MLKQEGMIQRIDLNLRIKYIGLETEIYQIDKYKFIIYCANYEGNFEELKRDFDYSIRFVTTDVDLTDYRPTRFLRKIENIPLSNVVYGFKASCITERDLDSFVRSKFHNVDITKITVPKRGIDTEILIEVSQKTEESEIKKYKNFF